MLKALVIDDEARARRILTTLLNEYCPRIQIVSQADDVLSGLDGIQKYQPDLVFLDIAMPEYSGFQLLEMIGEINFEIIFTTAFEEYALRAFQVSAIDYLLKPIQIDLLIQAVEKIPQHRHINDRLSVLKSNLQQNQISRIALPVQEGFHFIDIKDIIYLQADGAYTRIFLQNGQKLLISKNIKSLENLLNHPGFFRTHRSFLINLNCVKSYFKQDGGYIIMDNGNTVSLSRDRKGEFLEKYSSF